MPLPGYSEHRRRQRVNSLSEGAVKDLLLHRPAWYVLGPLLGLVVLGLYAAISERFGVVGGYSNVVERISGRLPKLGWKAWVLFGVLGGSLVYRLAAGRSNIGDGYGWLTRTFGGSGGHLIVAGLLVAAGVLIGFGAKTAGGCTSGNGLGGCSAGSTSSFAATATFMGTAIVCSFLIKAIT
ncbi:MAG TPA: YeeE/YedE thiosulfate transporter family protein [Thermoleophilaceae bacterium]